MLRDLGTSAEEARGSLEADEYSRSVICFLNFETPYHKRNIVFRQKYVFVIQHLLYNENILFDEKQYFFVVRCFEIERTNYRSGVFVGGRVLRGVGEPRGRARPEGNRL